MSIKSDKWIRQMSLEKEMIQPFEPNQLRHLNEKKLFLLEPLVTVMMFAVPLSLRYLPTSITTSLTQKTLMLKALSK